MGQTPPILIIRHPGDNFDQIPYLIQLFAQRWQEQDIPVEIRCDLDAVPSKDVVVISHLDVTHTPALSQRFFEKCAIVVNRNITDISKRKISRNLITSAKDYDGPVIVKTNRNAGGEPQHADLDLQSDTDDRAEDDPQPGRTAVQQPQQHERTERPQRLVEGVH